MTDKELAELMYPNVTKTIEDYEKIYPERDLPEGAAVSRFAPSPTGFVHMGSLLATLIERKDEGVVEFDKEIGNYGPYVQSERREIYDCFAKHLVERGLAYPCFCSAEELDETRHIQELNKERIGYYGSFAKCRNLTNEERAERARL